MKVVFAFMVAAFLTTALTALSPGYAAAHNVFESCGDDIASHCETVTPGDGRVFSCIYAHEDNISESCDPVIIEVASLLDTFFELVRFTAQECRTDLETHCMEVEMGGGQIYTCLKSHKAELTSDCSTMIESISLPGDQPG
ncbi:MAG: cysteine rich repeat-containing protein [Alphaproteobacteria bacterium]|nr:cysteine rich repeat-containing protein [Alphaproteobacteria bacterium]